MSRPSPAISPWSTGDRRSGARSFLPRIVADATPIGLMLLGTLLFVAALPTAYGMIVRPRIPAAKLGIGHYVYARGLLAKPSRQGESARFGGAAPLGHPPKLVPLGPGHGPFVREFDSEEPGIGVTRVPLAVRRRADAEAPVVVRLPRGKAVAVVKELGDWMLVAVRQEEKMLFGWVRHDEVAVLP